LPNWRICFLPSFCFSRSFLLRVTSLRAAPLLAQREDRTEIPVWHQDRRPNPRLLDVVNAAGSG
jgi:hypothetical protein